MTRDDRISAWLDGVLPPDEVEALEAEAAHDPELAAAMEAMQQQDDILGEAFGALLDRPVPDALTAAARATAPANLPHAPRVSLRHLAAGLSLLAVGLGSGAYLGRMTAPAPQITATAPGWMEEIATYHRVYARQGRHLVEVPAEEKDHIEAWLSKETGVRITVPDLAASGYVFRGARLLVAGAKPVAQLIYADDAGRVVALCALQSDRATDGFATRTFDDVNMVGWSAPGAAWVAVGEPGQPLQAIAEQAATEV